MSENDKCHFIGGNGNMRTMYGGKVTLLESRAINALMTVVRSADSSTMDYIRASDRALTILAEEGLASLNGVGPKTVTTPCGTYTGLSKLKGSDICAVSIVRSGDILLEAVRRCEPDVKVGKILIQRDETHPNKIAKFYYRKLPADVASKQILLCDPMLGTGGSACCAIQTLVDAGVSDKNIVFINVLGCHEGIQAVLSQFPNVRIITFAVDPMLNSQKYLAPGLGDFGDRYYST